MAASGLQGIPLSSILRNPAAIGSGTVGYRFNPGEEFIHNLMRTINIRAVLNQNILPSNILN
jgi:hypothetical protein